MALLNHDEICQLTPHAGNMCMLDSVEMWNNDSIQCLSTAHLNNQNPLIANGRLHALNCIELAGQATVVHGTLCWKDHMDLPDIAILVSVRDINIFQNRLETITTRLLICADVLDILEFASNYWFEVKAGEKVIVNGRLTSKLIYEKNS